MSYDKNAGVYKRVVPWYSINEWAAVYKLVYSQDPEERKNGLERLIGWKARCPNLPLGVECTLGIAQVLCEDPDHLTEKSESIAREQQLRLIYSTAVMRFLNMMFALKTDEELVGTLYMKASKLNIPEWIINLRHDAAHGISLPDLSLLRTATLFISKWLQEHYWESEAQIATDWHVTEADILSLSARERELTSTMETWEALSLYALAGFNHMRLIPDDELMSTISSIHKMLSSEGEIEERSVKKMQINHAKVSTALTLVLRRLVRFFSNKSGTFDKATFMAKLLVDGDFFLPSVSLMKLFHPNGIESESILQQLPQALINSCADLLSTLWNLGAIPALCMKLISVSSNSNETDLRRNIAALWTQKLILSSLKVREAKKVFSAMEDRLDRKDIFNHYKEFFPGAGRKAVSMSVALAAVDNQRPDLKVGYTWKITQIPKALSSLDLVKLSMEQPSKFSCIFLPSLMELTAPPIPLKSRKLLLELINLYNNNELSLLETDEKKVYSVNDLSNNLSVAVEETYNGTISALCQIEVFKPQEPQEESRWTLSQDYFEWNKCALGILPWQREQDQLDQEEHEGRQQQRTWPKLYMSGDWTKVVGRSVPLGHHCNSSRRAQAGRVTKPYAKQTIRAKVLKACSPSPCQKVIDRLSPRQKAIDILSSL